MGISNEEDEGNALAGALSHLASAAECIEHVASCEGHLDLVAQTHIASATALVEVLRKRHEESRRARAAAAG
jgi:replication-associated recombination protein RarA